MRLSAAAATSSFDGNAFAADEVAAGAAVEEESFALIAACDSKFWSYAGELVAASVGDTHRVRFRIVLGGQIHWFGGSNKRGSRRGGSIEIQIHFGLEHERRRSGCMTRHSRIYFAGGQVRTKRIIRCRCIPRRAFWTSVRIYG